MSPSLAALVALVLTSPARAEDCGGDSTVIWTQPATAEYPATADAVFRVLVGGGTSPASSFAVTLTHRDEQIPATVEIAEHPGETAYETRYLYTLQPAEALTPGERYVLQVSDLGTGAAQKEISVTVGEEPATPVQGEPGVTVRSATDEEGLGATSCDYGEMRTFELTLTPSEADPSGRSVLHLYRMKSEGDTWHYVQAYRVPEDGAALDLTLSFDRVLDWGGCFAAIQEDADGYQTVMSDLGCAAEPLLPADDEQAADASAVDSSPRSCASARGLAAWSLMWVGTLAVALRRERKA